MQSLWASDREGVAHFNQLCAEAKAGCTQGLTVEKIFLDKRANKSLQAPTFEEEKASTGWLSGNRHVIAVAAPMNVVTVQERFDD